MSKNGASILVVDDEREIVRALHRALKAHGYSVLTASSGEEAVEMVAKAASRSRVARSAAAGHERAGGVPPGAGGIERAHHRAFGQRCRTRQGRSTRPGSGRLRRQAVRYGRSAGTRARRLAPGHPATERSGATLSKRVRSPSISRGGRSNSTGKMSL